VGVTQVDVSAKAVTLRTAVARAEVELPPHGRHGRHRVGSCLASPLRPPLPSGGRTSFG
jgi:hypothetical protein